MSPRYLMTLDYAEGESGAKKSNEYSGMIADEHFGYEMDFCYFDLYPPCKHGGTHHLFVTKFVNGREPWLNYSFWKGRRFNRTHGRLSRSKRLRRSTQKGVR